jgi:hypothetical protein
MKPLKSILTEQLNKQLNMNLKQALMEEQGFTEQEARLSIKEMRLLVFEGKDPTEVLIDNELDPEYIVDIL